MATPWTPSSMSSTGLSVSFRGLHFGAAGRVGGGLDGRLDDGVPELLVAVPEVAGGLLCARAAAEPAATVGGLQSHERARSVVECVPHAPGLLALAVPDERLDGFSC